MKRLLQIATLTIALSIGSALLFAGYTSSKAAPTEAGAEAAPQFNEKTLEAMVEALNDGRRSEAQYQAVMEKFGEVRPFLNIAQAERRHQAMLLELFEKYKIEVPENNFPEEIAPATVRAACEAGVHSEKENVALYDKFLKDMKEPDIRVVFTKLRDASEFHHLPAFERCATGKGKVDGKGKGKNRDEYLLKINSLHRLRVIQHKGNIPSKRIK